MAIAAGREPAEQAPPFGVLGIPYRVVEGQRVDFEPDAFAGQIETKGQRLAWTRAMRCPCMPINDQSDQPDPNCTICDAVGYSYFGPVEQQDLADERLTDTQRYVVDHYGAFVIRGLLMGVSRTDMPWDRIGSWRSGGASCTVRSENRIGFMDRLINVDALISFTEVVEAPADPRAPMPTRYLVSGGVNMARTVSRRFSARDWSVTSGRLYFRGPTRPAPGERVALHYLTFPTWVVQDIPNASRLTNIEGGRRSVSAEGDLAHMPLRASVRLEFLPPMTMPGEPR